MYLNISYAAIFFLLDITLIGVPFSLFISFITQKCKLIRLLLSWNTVKWQMIFNINKNNTSSIIYILLYY